MNKLRVKIIYFLPLLVLLVHRAYGMRLGNSVSTLANNRTNVQISRPIMVSGKQNLGAFMQMRNPFVYAQSLKQDPFATDTRFIQRSGSDPAVLALIPQKNIAIESNRLGTTQLAGNKMPSPAALKSSGLDPLSSRHAQTDPVRLETQKNYLNKQFRNRPWSWWWNYNPGIFLQYFPVYFNQDYGYYPPIADDFFDTYGQYPMSLLFDTEYGPDYYTKTYDSTASLNSNNQEIQSGDCTRTCTQQCLNTTNYTAPNCLDLCNQECGVSNDKAVIF
jgi:hypothetical protein